LRTLDATFDAQITAYQQHLCWMIDWQLTSTYYYTSAQHNLVYGGNVYQARSMEVTPAHYTLNIAVNTANVRLDNVDKSMTSILEAEEVRGKKMIIREAALDAQGKFLAQEAVFIGIVDSFNYDKQWAEMPILSIMTLWRKKLPRRQASPSCQVRQFGDSYCTSAGAWCDRSYDRCVALSNKNNFRGFRFMPWLMSNPDIWWGSKAPQR